MPVPGYLFSVAATHRRGSSLLVPSTTIPFIQTLSRTDAQAIYANIVGQGLTAPLTIIITGTLAGVAQSETIILSNIGSQVIRSVKKWNTITQIASASISAGTVQIDARFGNGAESFVESVVGTIRGRLEVSNRPAIKEATEGLVLLSQWQFFTNDFTLRPLDILIIEGTRYEVQEAPKVFTGTAQHHAEVSLKRLN